LIVCRHEQNAASLLASVTKFAAEITAQRKALQEYRRRQLSATPTGSAG
jgi:hypothetical protein